MENKLKVTIFNEIDQDLINKLNFYKCNEFLDKIELLRILKKANLNKQEYHLIEIDNNYAFFCIYQLKLNIFTYAKINLKYPVKIIGFPCSIASSGYFASNSEVKTLMFDYISKIKGAKLVLNSYYDEEYNCFTKGFTLPTCIIENKWESIDSYLSNMRSSYRYRLNKVFKKLSNIEITEIEPPLFDESLYQLYLNVNHKSEFKLEKLEISYFKELKGKIIAFYNLNKAVGFVQIYEFANKLTFMFCGLDYSFKESVDLYYLMIYTIIKEGITRKVRIIDLGQTTENTKLRFIAKLDYRYFYANHSNKIINRLVKRFKGSLAYQIPDFNFKVMKDGE